MKRNPPGVLWIGLVALALISLIQAAFAIERNSVPLLVGVLLNLVLLGGLFTGQKWAYVLTLLFCGGAFVVPLAQGALTVAMGTLAGNALVFGPMLLATPYFWGPPKSGLPDPLRCPNCGYSLLGLTEPRCPECGQRFVPPT